MAKAVLLKIIKVFLCNFHTFQDVPEFIDVMVADV